METGQGRSDDHHERDEQPRVMWKLLWMAVIFSPASKSPGLPNSKNTPSASATAGNEVTAVSQVLIQIDSAGGGGEIGGTESSGRVAEIGPGDDGAGGNGRVQTHVQGDACGRPMPIVPTTVQELPMLKEITPQIAQVAM